MTPDLEALRAQLRALLLGDRTREEVAQWADVWVSADEPEVDAGPVWDALVRLSGADLEAEPGVYLHGDADFHQWLDDVENALDAGGAD